MTEDLLKGISPEQLAQYRARYAADKNKNRKNNEYKTSLGDGYSASIETVGSDGDENKNSSQAPDLIAAAGISPEDVKRYQSIIRARKSAEMNETEHPYRSAFNNAIYGVLQNVNKLRSGVNDIGEDIVPRSIQSGEANLRRQIETFAPKTAAYLKAHAVPDIFNEAQFRQDYKLPETAQGIQSLARESPEILATLFAPEAKVEGLGLSKIPMAGKYIEKVVANAIPQGVMGGLFNENNRGRGAATQAAASIPSSVLAKAIEAKSPVLRAAAQLAGRGLSADAAYNIGSSIGGDYLGLPAAVAGALVGPRAYMAKSEARHDFLRNLPMENVEENLAAAKQLGIRHLTPGEASGDKYILAREAELGSTHKGSRILQSAQEERAKTEKKAITNLFESMYKESEAPRKEQAYASAFKSIVPYRMASDFRDNEAIKQAERVALSSPAVRQKNKEYPYNSIGYWDKVKVALDAMHTAATREKRKTDASVYDEARKEIKNKLDTLHYGSEYKEARGIAERDINRRKLESAFDSKELSGQNLLNAIKSKEGYAKLQSSMRDAPKALEQLELFKKAFQNISDPDIAKQAAIIARNSNRAKNSTAVGLAKSLVEKFANQRYDKEAAELITNPNWYDEIEKLNQMGKGEKTAKQFVNLIGKVSAYEAAKRSSK